jgi:photosystem II stability/assembly factor-like uncharacterized protein
MLLAKLSNYYLLPLIIFFFIPVKSFFPQSTEWQSNGPYLKIAAEGITFFHSDPNIMLTGDNKVIYRSIDAGETWKYQCFFNKSIETIAMDPLLANIIYIGTSTGIYRSEDDGISWTSIGLGNANVNTIAIDKNNTNIIYAGTGEKNTTYSTEVTGIFKSTDGGGTWTHIFTKEIDCINEIIIDSDNSSIVFASVSIFPGHDYLNGEFLKSTNSGNSWLERNVYSGDDYETYGLIQSIASPNDLYCISYSAGNHRDLYRSTNKGNNWESIFIYYFAGPVSAVAADPQNPNILYAHGKSISDKGFYKSINKGNSWTKVTSDIPNNVYAMLINPNDSRLTITSSIDGILQSRWGNNWETCTVHSYITDLAVHPDDDNIIFAAIEGCKLFRSIDGNNSWEEESSSSANDNVVGFSSANPKLVVAAGGKYFHKSTDGGNIFSSNYYSFASCSNPPCDSYPEEILFKPNDLNKIIIGTSGNDGVLSMSSNGGTQWGYIEFGVSAFVFDPTNTNNIYAGTKDVGGVYKVKDIWSTSLNIIDLTPSSGIGNVNNIAVDVNLNLYVAATDGLWKQNGTNWNKLSGLPNDNITAVLLTKNYSVLFAGTENNGVYLSTDMGVSWSEFNNGLEDVSITNLAVGETNPNLLYAGTMRKGVWSTGLIVGVDNEFKNILPNIALLQNYPNPFNNSSVIKYSIPKSSQVTLKICNTLGEELEILVNEEKPAGNYELTWNAANLPSGVYFYSLSAGDFHQTKKMIVLK